MKLMMLHGFPARARVPRFMENLAKTKYYVPNETQFREFICNGLMPFLYHNPEKLWECLDLLVTKYQIKSLQTFMGNGVASLMATDPEKLWSLLDEFGQSLIKPMCNEVANKLKNAAWVNHLRTLNSMVDPLTVHACIHRGCLRNKIHLIINELNSGMTQDHLKARISATHDKAATEKNAAFLAYLLERNAAAESLLQLSKPGA